ncbi:CBS domain-containing protein [Phytoactinopolyspora alkaliphila]|uniref:CBS domain-containing protein n=2 Tax=Phytoactinopolyspora alkaliphila TaxID=1783498 RepID=A0A6N9YJ01_9ACTN|nr:CBS domain-containing protein [Phytoactinopolyspora alkaliphila]
MEQADRPVRVEEWRDPEPPADDDPASFTGREAGITAQTVADAMTSGVVAMPVDASATDAAAAMNTNDIGDVLVVSDDVVRGLVTDRDLTVRVAAEGRDPNTTRLGDVCSEDITAVHPTTSVEEAVGLMRSSGLRRLPVVDEERHPLGIVTIGDIAMTREPESALADINASPPNR